MSASRHRAVRGEAGGEAQPGHCLSDGVFAATACDVRHTRPTRGARPPRRARRAHTCGCTHAPLPWQRASPSALPTPVLGTRQVPQVGADILVHYQLVQRVWPVLVHLQEWVSASKGRARQGQSELAFRWETCGVPRAASRPRRYTRRAYTGVLLLTAWREREARQDTGVAEVSKVSFSPAWRRSASHRASICTAGSPPC